MPGSPEPTIGRVVGPGLETAGTGFLVSFGLFATCAHVVEQLGGWHGDVGVVLRDDPSGTVRSARVEPDLWRASDAEDVAFLRLTEPLLDAPAPLPLQDYELRGHYSTFGYPSVKPVEGLPARIEILGDTSEGGHPAIAIRTDEVSVGFSGAPVWDPDRGVVVGMVVSTIKAGDDPAGKQRLTSFMRPASVLWQICPSLRAAGESPYRGLTAFTEDDAELYFGREAATAEMIEALFSYDLVAIVGVSGSGKSSLARAGLAKAMSSGSARDVAGRERRSMRPGADPLLGLIAAFDVPAAPDPASVAPEAIADALRAGVGTGGCVLLVDQAERVFTACDRESARTKFLDVLVALSSPEVKVLLTLRADFYGVMLEHSEMARAIRQGQVTLLPMSDEELREAIVRPAHARRGGFEPDLVEQIIRDVSGRSGDLPLLEFALDQLWARDAERGVMTKESYAALGGADYPGVQGAIAFRAEEIWRKELSEAERELAQRVLLSLVTAGSKVERGWTTSQDTARTSWQLEWDKAAVAVARKLVDHRLLTSGQDPVSGQVTFEVAHEALLRAWPRLRGWVDDKRAFIQWYDRVLVERVRSWETEGRAEDLLLPQRLLAEAVQWRTKSPDLLHGPALEFVTASEIAQEHQRRREENDRMKALENERARHRLGVILKWTFRAAMAVLVVGVGVLLYQVGEIRHQTAEAERQRDVATLRALAAKAQAESRLEHDDRALLLARQAYALNVRHPEVLEPLLDSAFRTALAVPRSSHLLLDSESPMSDATLGVGESGRTLIAASYDGVTNLWDLDDLRRPPRVVGRPGRASLTVAISSDGSLAARGGDGSIEVRRVVDHEVVATFPAPDIPSDLAFSPDGNRLAAAFPLDSKLVTIFDVKQPGAPPMALRQPGWVQSLAWSADGSMLAVGGGFEDRRIFVWRPKRPARPMILSGHAGVVNAVAFSPRDRTLASAGSDGTVRTWPLEARDPRPTLLARRLGDVRAIAFDAAGRHLAVGDSTWTVRVWDLARPESAARVFSGNEGQIVDVRFTPDGDHIISSTDKGTVRLDAVKRVKPMLGAAPIVLGRHTSRATNVTFMTNETLVYGVQGAIRRAEVETRRSEQLATGYEVLWLAPVGGGTMIASIHRHPKTNAKVLELRETESGKRIRRISFRPQIAGTVTVSPDGNTVAVGGGSERDESIWLGDLREHRPELRRLPGNANVSELKSLTFSPDSRYLAAPSIRDSKVRMWDLRRRDEQPRMFDLGSDAFPNAVAFSHDGRWFAAGGTSGVLRVWRLDRPGDAPLDLEDDRLAIEALALSPDGKLLAVGKTTGAMRVWDLGMRPPFVSTFEAHREDVTAVAFSPDARLLASAGDDGIIDVRAPLPVLAEAACQAVWRDLGESEWTQFVGAGQPFRRSCPGLERLQGAG